MDLTDRGGRQGLVVEAGEYLGDGTAELALDHLTDRRGGHRGNAVTELGQFVDIGGRQEIGAGGKNLSQLDRRRPEFFQRQPEVIGARVCLIARGVTQPPFVWRKQIRQAEAHEKIACPVPAQNSLQPAPGGDGVNCAARRPDPGSWRGTSVLSSSPPPYPPRFYRHAGHIWRSHDELACGDASDGWSEGERWSVNQDALRVSAASAKRPAASRSC